MLSAHRLTCLLLAACLAVAWPAAADDFPEGSPDPDPVTPILCQEVFDNPDCIEAICHTVLDAAGNVDQEANEASSCLEYICGLLVRIGSETPLDWDECSDPICEDLPAIWEEIKITITPAVNLVGSLVPPAVRDIIVRVLLSPAFYCDPGTGGNGGPGCGRDVRSNHVWAGFEADLYYNIGNPMNPQVYHTHCVWVHSGVGGNLFVGEVTNFYADAQNGCSELTRAYIDGGLGRARPTVAFSGC